ncbi:hypothetical protein [Oceanomicrobium pacificus]|uniref:YtkA-like domain-containing protein n=1 Tax=Oceanomicrobium pacificus TaxID=2692916 RepID=A0A6B0U228_9RHOB|nr:hypothetical protein [Oceanomicrobium pacificus]MXU65091.1 hypothetical protein [Oceanomicrobium pacificus]
MGTPLAPVSVPFAALLVLCNPADGELRDVTATMPAHGHGMNYRPTIRQDGAGAYRIDGLLFHMPGLWRIEAVLQAAGETRRYAAEVTAE